MQLSEEGAAAAMARPRPGERLIVTTPQRPVRVAEMMSAMLPILEVFEEHGHADVDPHINYAYVRPRSEMPAAVVEAARRMVELGVTRARMLAPRADGDAEMFVTISGRFAGDPGAINRLVAERAEPKRDKLARAKANSASECHLFVWVDGTQPGAELAVAKLRHPQRLRSRRRSTSYGWRDRRSPRPTSSGARSTRQAGKCCASAPMTPLAGTGAPDRCYVLVGRGSKPSSGRRATRGRQLCVL